MAFIEYLRSLLAAPATPYPVEQAPPPPGADPELAADILASFGEVPPDLFDELFDSVNRTAAAVPRETQALIDALAERLDRYRINLREAFIHCTWGLANHFDSQETAAAVLNAPAVQKAVERLLVELLSRKDPKDFQAALEIQGHIPLRAEAAEHNSSVQRALRSLIEAAAADPVKAFQDLFRLSTDCVRDTLIAAVEARLKVGDFPGCRRILAAAILPAQSVQGALTKLALTHFERALHGIDQRDMPQHARQIVETFKLPADLAGRRATQVCVNHYCANQHHKTHGLFEFGVERETVAASISFLAGGLEKAAALLDSKTPLPFALTAQAAPEHLKKVLAYFEIDSNEKLEAFSEAHPSFCAFLVQALEPAFSLQAGDVARAACLQLSLVEAEELRRGGADLDTLDQRQDFEGLFRALCRHSAAWQDQRTVAVPFEQAARVFGFRALFAYFNQQDLSRHDALVGFSAVLNMVAALRLDPGAFFHAILLQIKREKNVPYPEGRAHRHLIALARNFNPDIKKTFADARQVTSLPDLPRALEEFSDQRQIFVSWNKFKRFCRLQQLVQQRRSLARIEHLHATNPRKYRFIAALAFHPASKVSLSAALMLALDPAAFLDIDDLHVKSARKKPSEYVKIPHLGLSAEELVDALIDGTLDALQAHSPLIVRYEIPKGFKTVRDALRLAVGSRALHLPGFAQNPGKLFHDASKVIRNDPNCIQARVAKKDCLKWYLAGGALTPAAEAALFKSIYDSPAGLPAERQSFVAQIHLKSDPLGHVAGDDTGGCMPFGSGKHTHYMFNLNTSLFTVQQRLSEGRYRTIAQSVLTDDIDVACLIPELTCFMDGDHLPLCRKIPESILIDAPSFITCDNVEVAPNYSEPSQQAHIELIYRDFFARYLEHLSGKRNLVPDRVLVGMGYSSIFSSLEAVPNTFAPRAPLSYSDNAGARVYELKLKHGLSCCAVQTGKRPRTRYPQPRLSMGGLSPLTFRDTLQTAYLEGRAYADNRSLMECLHNIENGLMAKDINNARRQRPNLSLKYCRPDGRMCGYLVAYQGERDGREIIYLGDLASDPGSRLAGGKLIHAFLSLYAVHYLAKQNALPVFANLRERTSYRLVRTQQARLEAALSALLQKKVSLNIQELGCDRSSGEPMHDVLITPMVSEG